MRRAFLIRSATLAIAALLAACSAASSSNGSLPINATIEASESDEASASTAATQSAAASESTFVCRLPIRLAATIPRAQIIDVGVETQSTFDRLTVTFEAGLPEVTLETAEPPLAQDPSDLPVAVQGSSFLRLILRSGTTQLPSGGSSYSGSRSFVPHYPRLVDVEPGGDFEAVSTWYLGLTGDACASAPGPHRRA